jgi:hypothetical protein
MGRQSRRDLPLTLLPLSYGYRDVERDLGERQTNNSRLPTPGAEAYSPPLSDKLAPSYSMGRFVSVQLCTSDQMKIWRNRDIGPYQYRDCPMSHVGETAALAVRSGDGATVNKSYVRNTGMFFLQRAEFCTERCKSL